MPPANRHRRKWSIVERVRMLRLYYTHGGNVTLVRRAWRRGDDDVAAANIEPPPSKRAILAVAARFLDNGSVADRVRPGRNVSVTTVETVAAVADSVARDPLTSTRVRAERLGLSRSSLIRILRHRLSLRAYKIQVAQWLREPVDSMARLEYARAILRVRATVANFASSLVTTDEAHFHLTGEVFNRQNVRFWGSAQPGLFRIKDPHATRVTVWCGVTNRGVIGPYFFEDARGNAVSVTGERYREMLTRYVLPLLRDDPRFRDVNDWWWQQDGATAHTARETMRLLFHRFGVDRVISSRSAVGRPPRVARPRPPRNDDARIYWPSRSPDLSPPDFFLWGYLKDRVYDVARSIVDGGPAARTSPSTLAELRVNIQREIDALNRPEAVGLLERVVDETFVRARECIRENGGHLKNIIFRT